MSSTHISTSFEIHLSRIPIGIFIVIALVFLYFGLEILVLHNWLIPSEVSDSPFLLNIAAGVFFGIVPLIILARLVPYIMNPPLMLGVDAENVTMGTGFSYKPMQIPTKHVTKVHLGVATPDGSTIRPENVIGQGGLVINFDTKADIPKAAITSAGIRYSFGRLVISRIYADKGLRESVTAIKGIVGLKE